MAYKILAILLVSSLFAADIFAEEQEVPLFVDGTVRVSAEEMIELFEIHDDLVIVDSRKKSDLAAGFIEGAMALPNTETSAKTLAQNIASKTTPVVFYCDGIKCDRSSKAAKIALAEGYKNIYWFRGGIQEWEAKGLPVALP